MSNTVPQPHPEPGDTEEVCCCCGLIGRQCIYPAECWHYHHVHLRGLVYAPRPRQEPA